MYCFVFYFLIFRESTRLVITEDSVFSKRLALFRRFLAKLWLSTDALSALVMLIYTWPGKINLSEHSARESWCLLLHTKAAFVSSASHLMASVPKFFATRLIISSIKAAFSFRYDGSNGSIIISPISTLSRLFFGATGAVSQKEILPSALH